MSDPNLQHLFDTAVAHQRRGRLAEAEPLYRQILAHRPDQPDVLHMLGVLYHQAAQSDRGIELIVRSAQLAPKPTTFFNLGEVFRNVGRLLDSATCFRRAVELDPNNADAHGMLGLVLLDLGDLAGAQRRSLRATQLAPQRAIFHQRLCLARQRQDDPHGAALAGRRAVELDPNLAEGWSALGVSLASAKKHAEALDAASRAITLAPQRPEAFVNLGFVHERAGRTADAEAAYRKSIELDPNYSVGHRNLAGMFDGLGRVAESVAALERALALNPNDVEGWNNLSTLRRRNDDARGSVAAAERALRLLPGHPGAHGNLGLALLALGEYERGFPEYEWRWRCDNFTTAARDFGKPMWDGSDPRGRAIFVHAEQGFGDTIQFVRYVPLLAERGATVYLECTLPLRSLLANLAGVGRVVVAGVRPPEFDLHIPLLSLPKLFKTTLATVPSRVPYLAPDAQRLERFKQKTLAPDAKLRVGLVWSGNTKPDPARTCPLDQFAPLAQIPGVAFFSLQKGDDEREPALPPAGMHWTRLSDHIADFADTAAAMMNLDLVLTIDTAAAHLAGALGRPTWTLLPWAADWRWLEAREDSPWYPTMRLFRQPTRGDWRPVIERVAEEMRCLVRGE